MKVLFLDIDGVLVNRESLMKASGIHAKAHPACVAALNEIVSKTGANVVVSSTWRHFGLLKMKDFLSDWGVKAKVLDCTPDLTRKRGAIYSNVCRGDEIQAWLDGYDRYPVESFVILDDDSDMNHLLPRLVKTEFERGLTMEDAARAIEMLG